MTDTAALTISVFYLHRFLTSLVFTEAVELFVLWFSLRYMFKKRVGNGNRRSKKRSSDMVTTSTMTTAIATALVAMLAMAVVANAADPAGYTCAGQSGSNFTKVTFVRVDGHLIGNFLMGPSSRPVSFSPTGEPIIDEMGMNPYSISIQESAGHLKYRIYIWIHDTVFRMGANGRPELFVQSLNVPGERLGSITFTIPCGPSSIGTASR